MQRSVEKIVLEIIEDKNLLPYFVDYIGENLKTAFRSQLEVLSYKQEFEESASIKFQTLITKLGNKVPEQYLETVVSEVCQHYAQMVHLSFQSQPFIPAFTN